MRKKTGIRGSMAAALCILSVLRAEALTLPDHMKAVEAQAFENCTQINEVVIPEGTEQIGDAAWRGCASLNRVTFPQSLSVIGNEAFSDCAEALYFICPRGSQAAEWARGSGFDYTAGTQCRALLIGQTYAGTENALYGTENDANAMASCLGNLTTTSYGITRKTDLTKSGILSAISEVFGSAGKDDISLFYYSGHGAEGGMLVGNDLLGITPSQLRTALDQIRGRKVIIVDACYSGGLIQDRNIQGGLLQAQGISESAAMTESSSGDAGETDEEDVTAEEMSQFSEDFIEAFSKRRKAAFTGAGDYYIITAASADERSAEGEIDTGAGTRTVGLFTYALCQGLGWDSIHDIEMENAADTNHDGAVTIQEAYAFAKTLAESYNQEQTALVYPENCRAFSPFRE